MAANTANASSVNPRSPAESVGLLKTRIEIDENTITGLKQVRAAEVQENASLKKQNETLDKLVAAYKNLASNHQKLNIVKEAAASKELATIQKDKEEMASALSTKPIGTLEVMARGAVPAILGIAVERAFREEIARGENTENAVKHHVTAFLVCLFLACFLIARMLPVRR